MNLFKIVLYSVLKKDFFDLLYNINCDPREYVGCTNVDRYFDIGGVEREELVDVGLGVRMSKPVVVGRGLKRGYCLLSSLSHSGVLAISYKASTSYVQLTDLVNGRRIAIGVGETTHTGFYDDSMVVLTEGKSLGVCSVEEMFSKKNVSLLKSIGDVKVNPFTDVSVLHSTRVLMFNSTSYIPHEFNVDTGLIRQLDIGKKVNSFASLTGVDVGVKGVFMEGGNRWYTYSLNSDNSASSVVECNYGWSLCTFIPSSSDPRDIRKGMKIYSDGSFFTDTTEKAHLSTLLKYQHCQSIVRLCQDIFLVNDANTKKWCLVEIIVP